MASKLTWKISVVAGKIRIQYHPEGKVFFGSTSSSSEWKAITVGGGAQGFEAHDDGLNGIAMSHDGRKIASYSTDGSLKMWSWPMASDKGELVTRFDCPVQSADFSACDNLIACGAQDGTVKIINIADTNQARRIKDHEGQVKGIAFDPQRQFIATAGADGKVNIYDYLGGDAKVASLSIVPAVPIGERANFEMEWSPSGKYLAVPVLSGVALVSRGDATSDSWKVKVLEEHKHEVYAVSWSPNGRYFVTAHSDQSVLLWDALSLQSIDRTKCPDVIVGVRWNRAANALLMITANGKYAEWSGIIPRTLADPIKPFDAESQAVQAYESQKQALDNMFADEEVQERVIPTNTATTSNGPETSTRQTTTRPSTTSSSSNVGATARVSSSTNTSTKSMDTGDDYERVSFKPSEFGASTSKAASKSSYAMDVASTHDYDYDDSYGASSSKRYTGGTGLFDLQAPFMPGATQSGAVRRFLVWNHIGSIVARVEEFPSPTTSMEMDFVDTSLFKPYSLTQPLAIDLATMSEQGIFTSGRQVSRDHKVTTTLQFHLFNKFGMKSDWTTRLEHGEAALALAAGDTWSAVATSQRRLRLFGEAGTKLAVMSLPGPVVSMVGKGPLLAVFYHCGNPFGSNGVPKSYAAAISSTGLGADEGNHQNLGWWIFNVSSRRFLSTGSPLPLSPGAQLNWIGFSTNDNALCTFDSAGVLRQLAATRQFVVSSTPLVAVEAHHAQSPVLPAWSDVWFDVLDTSDETSQKELDGCIVWPITVTEEKLRYAKIGAPSFGFGAVDGPSTQPKPIPSTLPLSMPFSSPTPADPAASTENKLIRNAISLGAKLASTIEFRSTSDGPLGDPKSEFDDDEDDISGNGKDGSFLFDFAGNKDILTAQQNVDKVVLQAIRDACHEGRVERAYGLAKTLFFKKSFQVAVTVASRTDNPMLAEKIAEMAVRKEAERSRHQTALKRMVARPVASSSQQFLAPNSQSQSLPNTFDTDLSTSGRKSSAKRSLPESTPSSAKTSAKANNGGGSDDEFEVESDDNADVENGVGSPASKKFVTQAIEDGDEDADHILGARDESHDEEDEEENGENGMDVDPATRGTTGSVFQSSPFAIAPPFKQGGGRLIDTLSTIGKSKNAAGSKKTAVTPAPKKATTAARPKVGKK